MRRASEITHVGEMIQVGRRGVGSARPADLAAAEERGVHFFGAGDIHRGGIEQVLHSVPLGGSVFITVDVDGLDPSFAPGTGTPEIGGLTIWQGIEIIRGCRGLPIVGCDLVEVAPIYDASGNTSLVAANLLYEMLCILPGVKYRE